MKTKYRVALEILAPVPLAILVMSVFFLTIKLTAGVTPSGGIKDVAGFLLIYLIYGYIFAGIPSLVTAGIMEWRFSRGLPPHSWRSVGLLALLGLASGSSLAAALLLMRGGATSQSWLGFVYFGALGLAVGCVLGPLIKILSRPKAAG
jgi:hypothetical protein